MADEAGDALKAVVTVGVGMHNSALRVVGYLLKLEQDWDFEGKTAQGLELEIRASIRDQLERELTGEETPEQVAKRVHRLVREKLGTKRRKVYTQKAA